MRIWLIQIGEPLPVKAGIRKLRTAYLADKLTQRGHNVLWWASAFDHFGKRWLYDRDEEVALDQRLTIKALKGIGYRKNISLTRYIDHRIIARKFRRFITSVQKPDIIVASLPSYDLTYYASAFAQENNIPCLADVRDQWPDIFIEQVPHFFRSLVRTALRKDFKMTERALKSATGIISMSTNILEWGLLYAGREQRQQDRVFYLGYKRGCTSDRQTKRIAAILESLKGKFLVTFIGTFAEYHNPSTLIECAGIMKNANRIHFVLAGDGQLMPKLKQLSGHLPNVTLTGWLNQGEIDAVLARSNIGVCTTNQTAYFFPNKAFAYFSAGLPVVSAFQGDLREVIWKHRLGFYYPPEDMDSLASCIKRLYEDPHLYKNMSKNAQKAFNDMFDANRIYDEYAKHVESVADAYTRASG
jgi:glycosyltransferase involved in cell wall biosynthesis